MPITDADSGVLQPEILGATYKPVSFGQDEPFRIYLPSYVQNIFDLVPRESTANVPRNLALISIFVVMWDYKWLQAQQLPGSQVEGLREYRELQAIVLLARFAAWGMTRWTSDAILTTWTSAFLGIISLVVCPLSILTVVADMVSWNTQVEIPPRNRPSRFVRRLFSSKFANTNTKT
jgi:hypothetical protein